MVLTNQQGSFCIYKDFYCCVRFDCGSDSFMATLLGCQAMRGERVVVNFDYHTWDNNHILGDFYNT
jgi:hypothetical protein